MADEKEKTGSAFVKAIVSSAIGLVSGAVIMYVSPLVNSAIKPPKPVPNFAYTLEGTTATFVNHSTGATQGWWDFGDGTALEPFAPNQATLAHKFSGTGAFTVKLLLHNLIGEEAERSAPVRIDAQLPPPTVNDFKVTAVTTNRSGTSKYPSAPATFRITGKLKNVELLIWSIDDQPLELVETANGALERYVTFTYYGNKKIRLMAVAGKNKIELEKEVWVDVPDEEPMILVQQHSFAAKPKTIPISVSFPAKFSGATYPFEVNRSPGRDWTIVEATLDRADDALVRNPKLAIAADKKSFTVTGELVRQSGAGAAPASWFSKVELKVANQSAAGAKLSDPVSAPMKLPGQTLVALPASKGGMAAGLEWELRQGMDVAFKDTKVPATQMVRLKDKSYRVTVTRVGDQLQFDTVEAGSVPALSTSAIRK